jgi:hypothetical protein
VRWCDLDLDGKTAMIAQQLQQYDGRLAVCPPKTAHSSRVIALDHTTVAALAAHRDRQRADAAAFGPGYRVSGFVFTNLNGDPMAPDRLTRIFKKLAAQAGLPPVRLHDLRHGAASSGADLRVVQEMLGHSSIVLIADTYTNPRRLHRRVRLRCRRPGPGHHRRPAAGVAGDHRRPAPGHRPEPADPRGDARSPHRQHPWARARSLRCAASAPDRDELAGPAARSARASGSQRRADGRPGSRQASPPPLRRAGTRTPVTCPDR